MAKPNKAVVVFSGGQDSTTCLFWAKKKYDEVIALSFNYGQRHSKELECAKKICKEHGVEHHILDMGLLNQLAPNSPHGGVFVVFAMNKVLPFFITLLIAGAISAALIVLVTKPQEEA